MQKITNDKVLDLENAARLASKEVVLKEALEEKQASLGKLERELKNSQVCKKMARHVYYCCTDIKTGITNNKHYYYEKL